MSDDDDYDSAITPPRGKSSPMWGDTQRTSTISQRRERERARMNLSEPITDTFSLVDREPSQAAIAVIERSNRQATDPARYADIVNLAEDLVRRTQKPTAEIAAVKTDLHDMKRDLGIAKWVVRGVAAGALGGLLYFAERVWTRAESEARMRLQIENLERTLEEARQDIRAMWREKDKLR